MEKEIISWNHLKHAMKGFENVLRCWICNKVVANPVSYHCSHFVCSPCATDRKSSCPVCSVPSMASDVRPDRTIDAIVGCFHSLSTTLKYDRSPLKEKDVCHDNTKATNDHCQVLEDTPSVGVNISKIMTETSKKSLTTGTKRGRSKTASDISSVVAQAPLNKKSIENNKQNNQSLPTQSESNVTGSMKPPRGRRSAVSGNVKTVTSTRRGKAASVSELSNIDKSPAPIKEADFQGSKATLRKAPAPRGRRSSIESTHENSKNKNATNDDDAISVESITTPKKRRRGSSKQSSDSDTKLNPVAKTNATGKQLSKKNHKGETPLHVACTRGDLDKIRSLLEAKANPNTKDNAGWTPLHDATINGYTDVVELLLKAGALVDVPGVGNVTPLHEAVVNNNVAVVKLLVSHGADIYARSSEGKTPIDLAKSDELKEVLCNTKRIGELSCPELNSTKLKSEGQKVLYGANGLSAEERKKLSTICSKRNLRLLQSFGPEVTHLIVPSHENSTSPPSMEVLSGILSGVLILSRDWLKVVSNDDNIEFDDEIFESSGVADFQDADAPRLSRLNSQKQLPGLFNGCHFYVTNNVSYKLSDCQLSRNDIVTLIRIGGGVVLKRNPDPEAIPIVEQTVPYHAPRDGCLTSTSHFIIYSPGKGEPEMKYNMRHCKTLPVEWFVNCVLNWRLLDP